MARLIKSSSSSKSSLNLKQYSLRRNSVLIYRNLGGLGDILMHRMIFEDIKNMDPDMKIIFACPPQYHEALEDHPYIDEIISNINVDLNYYPIHYNTSNACFRYESHVGINADKHRSDIWAEHCGVTLKNHNMHIQLTDNELAYGQEEIGKLNTDKLPVIFFSPISAMASKNLQPNQIKETVIQLRKMGLFVVGSHYRPIVELKELGVPMLFGMKIREWMGLISASDYVLSVDTAAFHYAGGIGKPVTGVFTWADGYVYGKYYPSATIVQLHRNTNPDWTCGPCYVFSQCHKCRGPLKPCLTEITSEMIINGVNKMINISCHK